VDGFVGNSETVRALGGSWLDGTGSLSGDLTRVLGAAGGGGVGDLTIAALLTRLASSGGPNAPALSDLLDAAERLGVANAPVGAVPPAGSNGTPLTPAS
jgi:hypothetical protein